MLTPMILIAISLVVFYLAFFINVFGFGLLIYDITSNEVFSKISIHRKKRLEKYFANENRFKYFVQIFNNLALMLVTLLVYLSTSFLPIQNRTLRTATTIIAIVIVWLIFLIVIQFFSKRTSSKWIVRTLIHRQVLISFLYTLFLPVVLLLERTLVMYKGGQISDEKKEDLVERAIESLADSAGIGEPLMEEDEKEMIENIFDLDQTSVKEVMVPRIDMVSLNVNDPIEKIREIVKVSGHSRFPVYGQGADDILGFLYVKDLFYRNISSGNKFDIREFIRKPFVIPETKVLDELLEELKKSRTHIALVVDEYGGTAGIVTMEDIIEVIVGDIQDEHDYEYPEIVKLEDGSLRVNANLSMEDLADFLDMEFEDERFETVGGLLYDLAGTLPQCGQILTHNGLEFKVEKTSGQRIESVLIQIINENAADKNEGKK